MPKNQLTSKCMKVYYISINDYLTTILNCLITIVYLGVGECLYEEGDVV